MKKTESIIVILFFISFLNSCGLIDQDAHSSMHRYDNSNTVDKAEIYFYDINKNIFIKIADGVKPRFVPNSDLVIYLQGENPMYASSLGINCVTTDGANDIVLAAKSSDFWISSRDPICSQLGDKILFFSTVYCLINVDGSSLIKIQLTDGRIDHFCDYSKDGKKILFQSDMGIVIYSVDTKTYKVISSVENIDIYNAGFSPRFSYDGSSLIYFYQSSTEFIMGEIDLNTLTNKILYAPTFKFFDITYTLHLITLPDDKIIFEDYATAKICFFDLQSEKPINFFGTLHLYPPRIVSEKIIEGTKILYKEGTNMFLYDLESELKFSYTFPITPNGVMSIADFSSDLKKFLYYKYK